jgi:flagellar basal-body rod protein FlgG
VPTDASGSRSAPTVSSRPRPGTANPVEIGQIMLVEVDDPAVLSRPDGGLYAVAEGTQLTDAQPGETAPGCWSGRRRAVQRRAYHRDGAVDARPARLRANAQIVQAADQLHGIANGLRR